MEMNTHPTIEELLDATLPMQSVTYQRAAGDHFFSELIVQY
jgi:hypothetical protein